MAFPCNHITHGPFGDLLTLAFSTLPCTTLNVWPYNVRLIDDAQWRRINFHIYKKDDHGYCFLQVQQSTKPCFCYQINRPYKTYEKTLGGKDHTYEEESLLFDEVDKKLYFVHFPVASPNYAIYKASVKQIDGRRLIENSNLLQSYLGRLDFSKNKRTTFKRQGLLSDEQDDVIKWFLNPFDGGIFQIHSYEVSTRAEPATVTTYHTVSWLKLDDTVRFEAPCGIEYNGKVRVIDQCQFEYKKRNFIDNVLFSKNGQTVLFRFRLPSTETYFAHLSRLNDETLSDIDSNHPYVSQMTKTPVYVVLGLNHQSNKINVLAKFDPGPSSYESHCDLLVSPRLLSNFGSYVGFPNDRATSLLSQRTVMIGQFLKYTFFSTLHKKKIAVLAVKSLPKALQNNKLSLTPKKLWLPMDDKKFREAFLKLTHLIKWPMLAEKDNLSLVIEREYILEVFGTNSCDKTSLDSHDNTLIISNSSSNSFLHLATIRVKLGNEYKDYRKCAGCGKLEQHKRRSKNGKRMSQFKVCGWCKDKNLHKMWWERPCHYCSEKCADDHWPKHKLEHQQPIKSKIESNRSRTKGKQKKTKK